MSGISVGQLSVVALLRDMPEHRLVRGQVGTIVEALDEATALIEFSDDHGRAYAIAPYARDALLPLRTASLRMAGTTPKIEIDPDTYEVRTDSEERISYPPEHNDEEP